VGRKQLTSTVKRWTMTPDCNRAACWQRVSVKCHSPANIDIERDIYIHMYIARYAAMPQRWKLGDPDERGMNTQVPAPIPSPYVRPFRRRGPSEPDLY